MGPLPAELGRTTTYTAAVLGSAAAPEAARRFVEHLVSPAGRARFAAAGLEPPK